MRAPVLGATLAGDGDALLAAVDASTRLTHDDPRARSGARLIAVAAALAVGTGEPIRILDAPPGGDDELARAIAVVRDHLARGATAAELAAALGLAKGVSGYVHHTVPVALFCWLRHPGDFRRAVEDVVLLGGDSDTTAAIVGGLAGASVGERGIPPEWIAGLAEWPRSAAWIRRLADRLARRFPESDVGEAVGPEPLFWPGFLVRNPLYTVIVLSIGLRRLLPPY